MVKLLQWFKDRVIPEDTNPHINHELVVVPFFDVEVLKEIVLRIPPHSSKYDLLGVKHVQVKLLFHEANISTGVVRKHSSSFINLLL